MKRKLVLAAGGLLLLLLCAALAAREQRAPAAAEAPRKAAPFDVGIPTAQEVRNMLAVYGERVDGTERQIAALRAQLESEARRADEARRSEVSSLERLIRDLQDAPKPPPPAAPAAPRFRTVEFERGSAGSLHVPAGSFGEATLLTGVYAPITGEPLPVLLRLDAALIGPQRSRVPLRGAFLVGTAAARAGH